MPQAGRFTKPGQKSANTVEEVDSVKFLMSKHNRTQNIKSGVIFWRVLIDCESSNYSHFISCEMFSVVRSVSKQKNIYKR